MGVLACAFRGAAAVKARAQTSVAARVFFRPAFIPHLMSIQLPATGDFDTAPRRGVQGQLRDEYLRAFQK